jgi:hypothetical protein
MALFVELRRDRWRDEHLSRNACGIHAYLPAVWLHCQASIAGSSAHSRPSNTLVWHLREFSFRRVGRLRSVHDCPPAVVDQGV